MEIKFTYLTIAITASLNLLLSEFQYRIKVYMRYTESRKLTI